MYPIGFIIAKRTCNFLLFCPLNCTKAHRFHSITFRDSLNLTLGNIRGELPRGANLTIDQDYCFVTLKIEGRSGGRGANKTTDAHSGFRNKVNFLENGINF